MFDTMIIPECSVPGCDKLAVQIAGKNDPRYPMYRRSNWIKEQYPAADNIWCCYDHHLEHLARSNGYDSILAFRNSRHPYLKYRKDYCENKDGRLGFVCNTTLPTMEMLKNAGIAVSHWTPQQFLDADHIDGDPSNNSEENIQTLCKHCHMIKSAQNGDHATPGRKTKGIW